MGAHGSHTSHRGQKFAPGVKQFRRESFPSCLLLTCHPPAICGAGMRDLEALQLLNLRPPVGSRCGSRLKLSARLEIVRVGLPQSTAALETHTLETIFTGVATQPSDLRAGGFVSLGYLPGDPSIDAKKVKRTAATGNLTQTEGTVALRLWAGAFSTCLQSIVPETSEHGTLFLFPLFSPCFGPNGSDRSRLATPFGANRSKEWMETHPGFRSETDPASPLAHRGASRVGFATRHGRQQSSRSMKPFF